LGGDKERTNATVKINFLVGQLKFLCAAIERQFHSE
jgi:hypothetical protein